MRAGIFSALGVFGSYLLPLRRVLFNFGNFALGIFRSVFSGPFLLVAPEAGLRRVLFLFSIAGSMYAVCMQYVRSMYAVCMQYVYCMLTFSHY